MGVDVGVGEGVIVGVRVAVGVRVGVGVDVSVGITTRIGTSRVTGSGLLEATAVVNVARTLHSQGTATIPTATTAITAVPMSSGLIQSRCKRSPHSGQTLKTLLLVVPQYRHRICRGRRWGFPQPGHTSCPTRISVPQRPQLLTS